MTRASLRLAAAALVAAAAASSPFARGAPDAPADSSLGDDPADDTYRTAELAERALGDLDHAATLYRAAALAHAAHPDARARDEIRAASCLRRLGRADEARALVEPLTAPRPGVSADVRAAAAAELARIDASPPPTVPPAASSNDAAALLAESERERDRIQQELEAALSAKEGDRAQLATLARRLREQDAEIAKLKAAAPPPAPETAEEILELRVRENAAAARQSQTFLEMAREACQTGRFEEARVYLYDALKINPDNSEARTLLSRVSDPLGDREALFAEALGLAVRAREVRASSRSADVSNLVEEARRRQQRGDFAGASAPLENALAALDAEPDLVRGGAVLRDEVMRMLQAATARGVARAPAPPPAPDAAEIRWNVALQDLLAFAGREVVQGLDLRFHDLGSVVSATGLPPVPFRVAPTGWTISVVGVESSPLVAAWLRASEPRMFATPGASVTLVGSTCAILADLDTHKRIAGRLEALRQGAPPAAELVIGAYRVDRAAVASALAARGVQVAPLPDGIRSASLDAADVSALVAAMEGVATGVVGMASLRVTPLRAFRLSAGPAAARFTIDSIVVPGVRPGVGLRTSVAWSPPGRSDGPVLRTDAVAGASTAPGGGLVVFGLPDAERPATDVAVVVRIGSAPPPTGAPLPPPAPSAEGADELRVPAVVARVEDPPAAPLLVPEHPVASRDAALLARLREAGARSPSLEQRARSVELKGDRVFVVGPDAARRAVADFLAQLDSGAPAARFDVRVHELAAKSEDRLRQICPRQARAASGAFWWVVLAAGTESRDAEFLLRDARGELPQRDPILAPPPTGRMDAARIVGTPYRSGAGTAPGGAAWGRGETAWIDEGLVVSLRPFGTRKDGRVDLDLSARARWVAATGRHDVATPLGPVPVLDPRTASWWGDVATPLGRGETLVLFGAPSPFAAGERARLVVTVRLAE